MTDRSVDVVVVGAGPAGSAAAAGLARAGLHVLLVDRARFPRDKWCGDGLTTGALRELEGLGLDPASLPSWTTVDDCLIRSPSGVVRTFPLPRGRGTYAAVARRSELDNALVELARTAGATVRDGHACVGARTLDDRVEVDVAGLGLVSARYAIAADGAWSPLRKALGLAEPGYRGEWHAFRQYVHGVPAAASAHLYVSFEPDFLPGYFWSFPVGDDGANIGFGIRRGETFSVGAMAPLWRELQARPHIRAWLGDAVPEGPHRAWPIPARIDRAVATHRRVLFVGDAVAAPDVLTGEGIGQALATGRWAAESVAAAGPDDPGGATTAYERRLATDLVPDHRMSDLLGRAISHRKGARTALWLAGLTPWTRRNFARWLFEDYPRAIVFTPGRWSPGVLVGPGTYRSLSRDAP